MTPQQLVKVSKFLSLHLRHQPERLGLHLQPGGWVDIEQLLGASARQGQVITRGELDEIVAQSDKQRFSLDATATRIRANQCHSAPVDLQLLPIAPPSVLYHGTDERGAQAISVEGLRKMGRQQVHLSSDRETARRVGARHGRPVVYDVDAAAMHAEGYHFYRADNGVWLVESVPNQFLRRNVSPSP